MARKRKRGTGCLLALGVYIVLFVIGFLLTRPPEITGEFDERVARRFPVALVVTDEDSVSYRPRTLEWVRAQESFMPTQSFLLPEGRVRMDISDPRTATVLEDHGEWQLIRYNYNNTYTAVSHYRAYANRVEPVSYRMTSSMGDVMLALALIIPAYIVAVLISRWRRRAAVQEGDN